MQILHTSDTHLGCAQFNYQERERDVYQAFEEVIDAAVKDRVDAVVHGGDIFHVPKPGGQPLLRFAEGIKRLADNGIKFYFTLGDHDIAGITGTPSPYVFHRLGLATFVGDGKPVYLRRSSSEELMVLGFHKRRRGEINAEFAEEMKRADELARSHEGKKVIVLHQGLYEFNKWAGEITVNDLPRSFDYYALGHLHDHDERRFEGFSGPLCYPGSIDPVPPERIQEYEKGFYIVDLSGEEARPDWIKIRCSRAQFRFEVDYSDVVRRLEEIRTDLKARGLAKTPVVHLDVRGRDVDSARLTSALAGLISSCLYCEWEVVDDARDAGEGSVLQERPEDVNEELLRFATKALGSEETASFALKELLPLLQGNRRDEAAELVFRAFETSRPLPADTRRDAPGDGKAAGPTGGVLAADDATAGGRTTRRRRSSGP
ncbi:MAG: exonuclease SbcCD subunit D [Nitrososphaerales archaeon]|jgi:DNA repair exonuclease SbcCD nuclease subunit